MEIEYYLHDGESTEFGEFLKWKYGDTISDELAEKASSKRPFYEVRVVCDLDEETGEVTLKWASL